MTDNKKSYNYGSLWTREELILAFDLYCRIPFAKAVAIYPAVIELANLIGRTPGSVSRKLGNFGSFDPELKKRQISGLTHAGKMDRVVWDEFNNNWNQLVLEAQRLREELGSVSPSVEDDKEIRFPRGASEKESIRKSRIHQAFFREAVLSSYEESCCITGLRIKECLVASHIIPWSVSERYRSDPHNGLCLSATFDRLFDRGLITLTDGLEVIISSHLRGAGDRRIDEMICKYHGSPIIRPLRFLPLPVHLEWHRKNVFRI